MNITLNIVRPSRLETVVTLELKEEQMHLIPVLGDHVIDEHEIARKVLSRTFNFLPASKRVIVEVQCD